MLPFKNLEMDSGEMRNVLAPLPRLCHRRLRLMADLAFLLIKSESKGRDQRKIFEKVGFFMRFPHSGGIRGIKEGWLWNLLAWFLPLFGYPLPPFGSF